MIAWFLIIKSKFKAEDDSGLDLDQKDDYDDWDQEESEDKDKENNDNNKEEDDDRYTASDHLYMDATHTLEVNIDNNNIEDLVKKEEDYRKFKKNK